MSGNACDVLRKHYNRKHIIIILLYIIIIIQVAALALKLLLAAIGRADMSLQYIFVYDICKHAPIRSIQTMDCQKLGVTSCM